MTAAFAPRIKTTVYLGYAHLKRLAAAHHRGWEPDPTNELDVDACTDLIEWGFLTKKYNVTAAGRKLLAALTRS
jgi:hypothetical protein